MEARASFRKTGISRLFVGVVLVIVAVGFGIMAAYLAASVTGTAGASQTTHSAPGSVLRQDNWSQDLAPAASEPVAPRRGGIQE
jgi:hypothetical protein